MTIAGLAVLTVLVPLAVQAIMAALSAAALSCRWQEQALAVVPQTPRAVGQEASSSFVVRDPPG